MATTKGYRSLCLLLGSATLALAANVGCAPSVPAQPTYEADVLPIFQAHCTRCHGDTGTDGAGNPTIPSTPDAGANLLGLTTYKAYLIQYADDPSCADDSSEPSCHFGAATFATTKGTDGTRSILSQCIHGELPFPMPLPPAPPLDSWELQVIDAWIAESPPRCSSNSDPTVCSNP